MHFADVYQQNSNNSSASLDSVHIDIAVWIAASLSHCNYDVPVMNDILSLHYRTSELVDTCVDKHKKGKALTGPDDLSVEHIIYAHPIACALLFCTLFKLIVIHRYVPIVFVLVLPLVKTSHVICMILTTI